MAAATSRFLSTEGRTRGQSSLCRDDDDDDERDEERARKGEKEERLRVRVREWVWMRVGIDDGGEDEDWRGEEGRGGRGMLISV
jgi:hypothetical protein